MNKILEEFKIDLELINEEITYNNAKNILSF
jgi:hypothetical protein